MSDFAKVTVTVVFTARWLSMCLPPCPGLCLARWRINHCDSNQWLVEIMGITSGPKHLRMKLAHKHQVSLFPAAVTWKPAPDGGTRRWLHNLHTHTYMVGNERGTCHGHARTQVLWGPCGKQAGSRLGPWTITWSYFPGVSQRSHWILRETDVLGEVVTTAELTLSWLTLLLYFTTVNSEVCVYVCMYFSYYIILHCTILYYTFTNYTSLGSVSVAPNGLTIREERRGSALHLISSAEKAPEEEWKSTDRRWFSPSFPLGTWLVSLFLWQLLLFTHPLSMLYHCVSHLFPHALGNISCLSVYLL